MPKPKKSRGKAIPLSEFLKSENETTEATKVVSWVDMVDNDDDTVVPQIKKVVLPTATRATLESIDIKPEVKEESKDWRAESSQKPTEYSRKENSETSKRTRFGAREEANEPKSDIEFSRDRLRTREEIEAEERAYSNGKYRSARFRDRSERQYNVRRGEPSIDAHKQVAVSVERPKLNLLPRTKPLPVINVAKSAETSVEATTENSESPANTEVNEPIDKKPEENLKEVPKYENKERPRLRLLPRSLPKDSTSVENATNAPRPSSIFGKAKPIDTARIYVDQKPPLPTKNNESNTQIQNNQTTLETPSVASTQETTMPKEVEVSNLPTTRKQRAKKSKSKAPVVIDDDGFQLVKVKQSAKTVNNQNSPKEDEQSTNNEDAIRKNKFETLTNITDN